MIENRLQVPIQNTSGYSALAVRRSDQRRFRTRMVCALYESRFYMDQLGIGGPRIPARETKWINARPGIDISDTRAERLIQEDLSGNDLILAAQNRPLGYCEIYLR